MKCLARLGDTQKMVEFAQLARDPNLFVLAANYLRSALTWQSEPTILKAIVTFYRKAKKFSALAAFFVECSNHTIDTTGDYGRGIGKLKIENRYSKSETRTSRRSTKTTGSNETRHP